MTTALLEASHASVGQDIIAIAMKIGMKWF
jgi:hypothetical protein